MQLTPPEYNVIQQDTLTMALRFRGYSFYIYADGRTRVTSQTPRDEHTYPSLNAAIFWAYKHMRMHSCSMSQVGELVQSYIDLAEKQCHASK